MTRAMTQKEIVGAFATFGVSPKERDVREIRDLMRGTSSKQDGVLYRTVLTNGTGKVPSKPERADAELERDVS